MKIDPSFEVNYRMKLAIEYFKKAKKFFESEDYKESVEASQLSVEDAAKAIIALKRLPSWSHDPSYELFEIIGEFPQELQKIIKELADIAHELAPEHGIATYGKPSEGLTPWEIYNKNKAYNTLKKAERAINIMKRVLK